MPPRPTNVSDLVARVERLEANLELVRQSVRVDAPTVRPPAASVHEFDEDVRLLDETLRTRVKDDSRFDSNRARAIVKEAVATAKRDDKAALWDALLHGTWKVVLGLIGGLLLALLLMHFGWVRP